MRELIEMLDNREKRYVLLLIKGYSFAEIAKSEGVSRQCVHLWVQRARKKLKEWGISEYIGDYENAYVLFKKYFEESKQKCETLIKNNQEDLINQHISNSK